MSEKFKRRQVYLLLAVLLAAATAVVYAPVARHDFVNLDDRQYVVENPAVRDGLSLRGLRFAFTSFHASNWHPLTWLSHMLDCSLFGLDPAGHHLVSLFFHILNTVLLFLLLARMTGSSGKSAFVAALFALHPLHVESVAWVAERKDVLSTFLGLLTLISYVRYAEKGDPWEYGRTAVLYAIGLMAKPMLVSLPLLMLLLDYWPLRRLVPGEVLPTETGKPGGASGKGRGKRTPSDVVKRDSAGRPEEGTPGVLKRRIVEKIPFILLAAVSSLVTLQAQSKGGALRSLDAVPFADRVSNALVSWVAYIWKMLVPVSLSPFYPYPAEIPFWKPLAAAALLVCVTAAVFRGRNRFPWLITGWFWYLVSLVPVIGIVQVGPQSMADRYTYVPLIGLFILFAWGMGELAAWRRIPAAATSMAAVLLLSGLAALTWQQAACWKNSETLFRHALRVTDRNDLAHVNLAVTLAESGKREEAIQHYREAIRIRPGHAGAHFNLANQFLALGREDEAALHYAEAIRLKPDYTGAHNNLASLCMSRGLWGEAESHLLEARKHGPVTAGMLYNLGLVYAAQGDPGKAVPLLREAVGMKPDYAEAYNLLGVVLNRQGRKGEAAESFRKALLADPKFEAARLNLERLTGEGL